jgi:divalent metal cation (Fe/Co/Zn/Cd) transporter
MPRDAVFGVDGEGRVTAVVFPQATAYHAVLGLFEAPHPTSYIALLAAIISLVWKFWLYRYTIKLGKVTKSKGHFA